MSYQENATAKAARLRAEAASAKRADVTTPLAAARPIVVLSTTVIYRGRQITVSNEGMSLDQFCDMLDKRFGKPAE